MASGRFWKGARLVTAETLGAMVVFTGVVAGLVFLIRPRMRRHKQTDLAIFDLVKQHTNDRNTRIMSGITKMADHRFLVPANLGLIAYFLLIRRRSWFSIRVAAVALSSLLLMFAFKRIFRRKRPLEALLILSMAGLISGVGISRVYLRMHYASDVAVGFLVGTCWLIISLDLLKRIEEYNKQQGTLPVRPVIV